MRGSVENSEPSTATSSLVSLRSRSSPLTASAGPASRPMSARASSGSKRCCAAEKLARLTFALATSVRTRSICCVALHSPRSVLTTGLNSAKSSSEK